MKIWEICSVKQIWIMFRPSIVIALISYIRLMRSIGKRFLQVVILYNENCMKRMPWWTSSIVWMWIVRAEMNLTTKMMVTSLPFDIMLVCLADLSEPKAVAIESNICSMNIEMQFIKMASSFFCSNLIGCVGSLGSANTIYLRTGSFIRTSRSMF